jgi:hypothetical protein
VKESRDRCLVKTQGMVVALSDDIQIYERLSATDLEPFNSPTFRRGGLPLAPILSRDGILPSICSEWSLDALVLHILQARLKLPLNQAHCFVTNPRFMPST